MKQKQRSVTIIFLHLLIRSSVPQVSSQSTNNNTTSVQSTTNTTSQMDPIHTGRDETSKNISTKSEEEEIPTVFGMEQLCTFLNITMDECSCAANPDLCEFEEYEKFHVNKTEKSYVRSHTETLVYTIATLVASSFGTLGNISVLVVAYKQRRSLTSCKLHIAENALINLVFSLTSIINVTHLPTTNIWPFNLASCKLMRTLIEVCGLLTVGIILIIAVERFFLIVHSVEVEGRFKHIAVGISTFVVIVTVVPYTLGADIEEHSERCIEFGRPAHDLALPYHWFVFTSLNLIPFCVITFLYARIVKYISSQASGIEQSSNQVLYMRKMKANRRVMLVALCILLVFLFTTIPTRVIRIYFTMQQSGGGASENEQISMRDMDLHLGLVLLSYLTFPFQSNLNPVMYSMVDTEWRKEVRNLLKQVHIVCSGLQISYR